MVKNFTAADVDAMIVLRFRRLVTSLDHPAFVTYDKLGRLFKISITKVRSLIIK